MIPCPVCDNNAWKEFLVAADIYQGTAHTILRCDSCGLAQTGGGEDSISSHFYRYAGSCDAGERFGYLQGIMGKFRRVRSSAVTTQHPGRVLDVGCGDGSFLEALARQGWQVFGTELSESIALTARKRLGDCVRVGAIDQLDFPAASFDLVTFWHVLEHLEDPKRALIEARRLLKAGGRLVVALPNIESLQAWLFGDVWLHLDVPRHRWHFSPRTLAAVADRCGLRVERTSHFSLEYGPFAIVQGVATKIGLGHYLFAHLVRDALAQLVRDIRFWTHVPLVAVSAVPSVLLELVAASCGRGGAVVMTLKPK